LKKRCSDQNGCLERPGSSEGWRDHPAELGIHAEQVAAFFNSLDFLFLLHQGKRKEQDATENVLQAKNVLMNPKSKNVVNDF